ncbi:MAG: hypothetical protein I8H75_06125 [Myxococcaceae bacterium]|nr:hypothetical protein [Myxococcaceae bacterium]MBH2006891.1 hypothetical protein [Myxococcaceae bacterium]
MSETQKKAESIGYPTLESLIEQVNPDFSEMREHQRTLLKLSKSAQSAKEKASASQAALAYQRFFELFDKILEIKNKIMNEK